MQEERLAHQPEVGQKLRHVRVVAAGPVRAAARQAAAREHQAGADARQLQAIGLLGVQAPVAVLDLGQPAQVEREGRLELRRHPDDADRHREVRAQRVDDVERVADRVVLLEVEHGQRRPGRDVRVAVAVAADPAPEGQGPGTDRERHAGPGQLVDEHAQGLADGVVVQRVEVEDGVARLVADVRGDDPQLVGLPQQLDELLQAPAHTARRRLVAGDEAALVEQHGDLADLREDGAPRGLRRVRGEDGPHGQAPDGGRDLAPGHALGHDTVDRLGQPPPSRPPPGLQLARPVHLLGDVREVEERREGADELGRRDGVHARQQRRRGGAVGADQAADALDEVEDRASLLAGDRRAQDVAELADVPAQGGVRRGRGVGHAQVRRRRQRGNWDSNPDSRFWRPRA